MAKFLRIGVHDSNVSGYTSKAWSVRRVGSNVLLKWGAVDVDGAGEDRRIYWTLPPQQKTVRCRTEKRALAYMKSAISRRLNHRYERLRENVPIRPRPGGPAPELNSTIATILFIDIVSSTEKAALLGDRHWTKVVSHYYAVVERELRVASGRKEKTVGDGIFATFDAPVAAIRCAAAIRTAVRTLGLEIRAGLHTGEYVAGEEVVGIAINIGARVADKARPSEVLVSSAVKDLVAEAGIGFKYRGTHKLKGVPQGWRLYVAEC